jgi:hypothetical protein
VVSTFIKVRNSTHTKKNIKVRVMELVGEKLRQVMSWIVISTVLTLVIVSSCSVIEAKKCSFPAIFNFGDSNSDTGGLSAAYCDGRLIIDFLGNQIKHLFMFYIPLVKNKINFFCSSSCSRLSYLNISIS